MNKNDLQEERYTVYRDREGTVRRVKKEKGSKYNYFSISFLKCAVVFVTFWGGVRITGIIPTAPSTEKENSDAPVQVQTESVSVTSEDILDEESYDSSNSEDGIMIPYSSSQFITEDDIINCDAIEDKPFIEVIQYAINEIYARNGYDFQDQYWRNYYTQYSWYINKGYNDAETKERFNVYEEKNIKLLIAIRKDLRGY